MLSERSRNIMVGLTVLVGLALLMAGIFFLEGVPGAINSYPLTLISQDANGLSEGAKVLLNGVPVGQVKSVGLFSDPAGKLMARIVLQIENRDIPASASATLNKPQAGVGSPSVSISVADMKPPMLSHDGSATLQAQVGDSGLIPKDVLSNVQGVLTDVHDFKGELSALAAQLSVVAKDLHTMLEYAPPEAIGTTKPGEPSPLRENISTAILRFNHLEASLEKLLADPDLQKNVRDAFKNVADASAELKTTLEGIRLAAGNAGGAMTAMGAAATRASMTLDSTQHEIARVSQSLVETLGEIEKLTRQIAEGNGTTGKLINDGRLYESLVDLSKGLKGTVDKLDFLLDKWKDEGVPLRIK